MFTVRLTNAQLIKDWNKFNPKSLRAVKAKVHVEHWNGSVGAKAELQQAWFRVRGVPYDKTSVPTMAYVGSLVGSTQEVDKSTLNRTDYVRISLAARDITKVPKVAEGAISKYLYDFFFEREVEEKEAPDKVKTCRGKIPRCEETPIMARKHRHDWIPPAANGWGATCPVSHKAPCSRPGEGEPLT
jgi:hypothetical protein